MQNESKYTPLNYAFENESGIVPDKALTARDILISSVLDHEDFTDNGDATAEIDIGIDIPKDAIVEAWAYEIVEPVAVNGAAGETDYTLQLGDGTDVDRFDPATDPGEEIASQVLSSRTLVVPLAGAGGSGDGELHATAAVAAPTLTLTLTGGTPDAGNFVHANGAGKFRIYIFVRKPLANL